MRGHRAVVLAMAVLLGIPAAAAAEVAPSGRTGTGLDRLVEIIASDPALDRQVQRGHLTAQDRRRAAEAATELNHLLVEAIRATAVARDGRITAADVMTLSDWLRLKRRNRWAAAHGSEQAAESGFHLVRGDGSQQGLFGAKAVDDVADGIYHLGFGLDGRHVRTETGARGVDIDRVARWLDDLLADDLARGSLVDETTPPPPFVRATQGHRTGTGLDRLVEIIATDPALDRRMDSGELPAGDRQEGLDAAARLNQMLVEAIRATGVARGGSITPADVLTLADWLGVHRSAAWARAHGGEQPAASGFHLVRGEGGQQGLFGARAVDHVADGIYHLGFGVEGRHVLTESGGRGERVDRLARWLDELLRQDLSAGRLVDATTAPPPFVGVTAEHRTGTGLDALLDVIATDRGLDRRMERGDLAAGDRQAALDAAAEMNRLIARALHAGDAGADGTISEDEVAAAAEWLALRHGNRWARLHGEDAGTESGFHLVRGDGGENGMFGARALDHVADGIYHLGFGSRDGHLLTETGGRGARLQQVAGWLQSLLASDLTGEGLAHAAGEPVPIGTTGTGLDRLVQLVATDPFYGAGLTDAQLQSAVDAADQMNHLLLEAFLATGATRRGHLLAADLADVRRYLQQHYGERWALLHGGGLDGAPTGFGVVVGAGGAATLFGRGVVDEVADAVYRLGLAGGPSAGGPLLDREAPSLRTVATWLNLLHVGEGQRDTVRGWFVNVRALPAAARRSTASVWGRLFRPPGRSQSFPVA